VDAEGPDSNPLTRALAELAGLPDDSSSLRAHLEGIAQLAVGSIGAVDYASVTAADQGGWTTVATTGEVALAVAEAQYAEGAGPCLDAAQSGAVVGVDDTATVVAWPGFRDAAMSLGLRSSLSIPLFTGSGVPSIALNLYAHERGALMPLALAVEEAYLSRLHTPPSSPHWDVDLDDGGRDMVAGLRRALELRNALQRAIGVVMARDHVSAADAYVAIRLEAAERNQSLLERAEHLTSLRHEQR